jgi:hypothetical protein
VITTKVTKRTKKEKIDQDRRMLRRPVRADLMLDEVKHLLAPFNRDLPTFVPFVFFVVKGELA